MFSFPDIDHFFNLLIDFPRTIGFPHIVESWHGCQVSRDLFRQQSPESNYSFQNCIIYLQRNVQYKGNNKQLIRFRFKYYY